MLENIIALSLGIIICQLWSILSKLNKIAPDKKSDEMEDKTKSHPQKKDEGKTVILFICFTAFLAYQFTNV